MELKPGDSVAGLLADGVKANPFYVAASLTWDAERGITVEVPYLRLVEGGEQFDAPQQWFSWGRGSIPTNLVLFTAHGAVQLYDNKLLRSNLGGTVSSGVFQPLHTVLRQGNASIEESLAVRTMYSRVDGIYPFAEIHAVKRQNLADEKSHRVYGADIAVRPGEAKTWTQNGAELTLTTDWDAQYAGEEDEHQGLTLFDWVVLKSSFDEPVSIARHMEEQRKFIDFLTIGVFGAGLYFRGHKVEDAKLYETADDDNPRFAAMDGAEQRFMLITLESVSEYRQKPLSKKQLSDRTFGSAHITPVEDLTRWGESWDKWQDFILPLRWLHRRTPTVPSDFIVNCAIAMEKAGFILGKQDGEEVTYNRRTNKPSTATYQWRCLQQLQINWKDAFGTDQLGIARAITNHYNGVKHPKDERSGDTELWLMAQIAHLATRFFSLWLADPSRRMLNQPRISNAISRLGATFAANDLALNDEGNFVTAFSIDPSL